MFSLEDMEIRSHEAKGSWYAAIDVARAIVKKIQAAMVQALASRFLFFNPTSAPFIEEWDNSNLI